MYASISGYIFRGGWSKFIILLAFCCVSTYISFQELRFQDYQQGRKTAQAAPNAFGQSSAFSAQPQTNSVFGQPQNQQINSVFGAPKPATGFGFNANNNSSTGTSIFGSGGNAFGQTQPQQQQQQTQTTGFGAFGQPQQPQQQGTGLFGNTNNNAGSAFGTGGSTLGNTGGAFGQPQPQQQQTSIFGQTQQQPATNTGFGAFGNNNNANKSSIFGQPSQPAQATTTGFGNAGGLFSNNNQNPQGQQTTSLFGNTGSANTGPFGNTNNQQQQGTQPATGGSIFGNTQNQNTGTTGTSLFSGGGGLFGNNNQQQQQQQQPAQNTFGLGGSLFGNKPTAPAGNAGTSLFNSSFQAQQPANNTQQGTGMFGNLGQSTNQQQQSTLGGGLFANANKAPGLGTSTSMGGTGLFSSTLGASTNTFNASAATPGAQGSLTASISQPISTNLPIFSMLPPGPRSVDLDQSTKKKPGFYIDVPTRSPVSRVQLGYTPANSRLRGFGSSTTHNSGTNLFASTNTLTVSRSQTPKDNLFGSGAPSPSLGSGQRKSVKKLILDKKVEPTELFTKSGSGSPLRGAKITFSPALSIAAREKEATEAATLVASSAPSQPAKSPTPTPRPQRTPNRFTAENGAEGEESLQEGDYWSKPSVDVLKTMGFDQLSSFEGLVVGRVGYGEIHFLEPVDLTGVPRLTALLGEVIKFDDKECAVYPESEDDKPPPGSGLNVRARISLRRCWATDKAHREPIKDEKNPLAIRHVKRLKGMKDTHFESFDISDGTWTFTVDHF
ncbi:hypothetical protein K435DRAFT_707804 [Dendrothele bispora CBS 962.96]|uniref:Peptidase S59 domain-containing protein n=1 Tax=Dendrothele bispora (strain CBS 962.96) TaxID=1314807 RepID=A0A4S8MYK0_DENBC|nr:hypothetical protein K435DRAFT_707804 [Dendrothele bispora CBS 962.96]